MKRNILFRSGGQLFSNKVIVWSELIELKSKLLSFGLGVELSNKLIHDFVELVQDGNEDYHIEQLIFDLKKNTHGEFTRDSVIVIADKNGRRREGIHLVHYSTDKDYIVFKLQSSKYYDDTRKLIADLKRTTVKEAESRLKIIKPKAKLKPKVKLKLRSDRK